MSVSALEPASRREALRETMRAHGLSRRRVAELCLVSRHTVDSWLLPPTSRAAREMPAGSLELLRLRLRDAG